MDGMVIFLFLMSFLLVGGMMMMFFSYTSIEERRREEEGTEVQPLVQLSETPTFFAHLNALNENVRTDEDDAGLIDELQAYLQSERQQVESFVKEPSVDNLYRIGGWDEDQARQVQ